MTLYREEVLLMARGSHEGSDEERAGGEVELALRGGGYSSPSSSIGACSDRPALARRPRPQTTTPPLYGMGLSIRSRV